VLSTTYANCLEICDAIVVWLQVNGRGRTSGSSSSSRRSSARDSDDYDRDADSLAAADGEGEVWPSLEKFKDMLRKVSAEISFTFVFRTARSCSECLYQ
jgi:hypothetical protein